jgi:sarcosine oxidase
LIGWARYERRVGGAEMKPIEEFDSIVVGLGALGSAAVYWLARRGEGRVLGLEQFALGHDRGASEDHSRIIRLSYHTPEYVALAKDGYAAWREVEEDGGEPLLVISGGLDLFPHGGAISIEDYAESMGANGVPFERVDAAEITRRWPQFRLDDGVMGLYQADSGIAPASKGNDAHRTLAKRYGATLLDNTPVIRVTPLADGVEVETPKATYRCRFLVLAVDAWTNQLLEPLGMSLPLTLMQEQVTYYASSDLRAYWPDRFPVWIWMDNPCFYGLPIYGEESGVKVAQDVAGVEVTLETRSFEPHPDVLAREDGFRRRTLPGIDGPPVHGKTCIYTLTPDRDFVVDTLPGCPQIALALGAGHAFKFASVLGRLLSDMACAGETSTRIASFAIDRPILTMEDPPTSFVV